jgi:prepilin-type N-terminal cleavage/methylation domain-containing protein
VEAAVVAEIQRRKTTAARRGFTLIELMVAALIVSFVLGSVALSVGQLGRARNTSKLRVDAFRRADAALNMIRRDIASITRSDDLFFTRLLLTNDVIYSAGDEFDRDELLIFNTRVRPLHDIDFHGEGYEYETQYRISDDQWGPVLWQRADPFPDEYPAGGGVATPGIEGILGLTVQVYDGEYWYDDWDSDVSGLPHAVSVTVLACGHRDGEDIYTAPRAFLRTVIPIDRVLPPKPADDEEEAAEGGAGQDIDGDGIHDTDLDGDGTPDPSSGIGGGGGDGPPQGGPPPGGPGGGPPPPGGGPPPPPPGGGPRP